MFRGGGGGFLFEGERFEGRGDSQLAECVGLQEADSFGEEACANEEEEIRHDDEEDGQAWCGRGK